ncbi:hypothetical protein X801_09622 [Opisthorchis viverrini]|uniref:Uncharacterized protein n=1 Tax=Opisthorchis viverrini TaxID=6198 RepID=A0A1S8WJH0_OPIVI|nr:hypothetical protein X801_09622 [Opisthorchis viverrini]
MAVEDAPSNAFECMASSSIYPDDLQPRGSMKEANSFALYAGPFRYLDIHGAAGLVKRMEDYRKLYGDHFAPCELLMQHAKDPSKKFHAA